LGGESSLATAGRQCQLRDRLHNQTFTFRRTFTGGDASLFIEVAMDDYAVVYRDPFRR